MKVLFTCGGTGGHIYPAIAMYHEFKNKSADFEYLFVGSDYGLERDIMKHEGLHMEFVQSRGIKRSLSLSNLKAVFCNLKAFAQAKRILKRFQPDLVISTGAYPTFHITYYAVRKQIPVFLIESNVMPGLVTRLFSGKAQKIFVGSDRTLAYLKDPGRAEVTGTPSRLLPPERTREEILNDLDFRHSASTVVVMGGSCGAERINDSLLEIINEKEISFQLLWATGKKHFAYVRDHIQEVSKEKQAKDKWLKIEEEQARMVDIILQPGEGHRVRIVDYIDNMNEILSVADLVVCRAGATTIREIKEFRVPAILIPFAQATGNHQYINALELEEAGCAGILEEDRVNGEILIEKMNSLLSDEELLKTMRKSYDSILIENSNQKIYESIMTSLNNKKDVR
jgi:UDP-N-acetylglucosamine--N-acetylmuramyl-(pentapeptide) pyrophosphoryl-undecaprenol N-acetylglucosamine transferase